MSKLRDQSRVDTTSRSWGRRRCRSRCRGRCWGRCWCRCGSAVEVSDSLSLLVERGRSGRAANTRTTQVLESYCRSVHAAKLVLFGATSGERDLNTGVVDSTACCDVGVQLLHMVS